MLKIHSKFFFNFFFPFAKVNRTFSSYKTYDVIVIGGGFFFLI